MNSTNPNSTNPTPPSESLSESSSESLSAQPWRDRVNDYVDNLAKVAEKIDLILDETRIHTIGLKANEVNASTTELIAAITELEEMIERRDVLLRDADAPEKGLSLSEKLLTSRKIEDARLARRCGEVAEMMETTHQRATALFVCQYHLNEFQKELLQRLSGATAPPTYGKSRNPNTGSGGLFNEAA